MTCTLTHFADGAGGLRPGVGGGLHGGDVADDDGGDQRAADLFHRAGERDVGGLEHRVGAGDERGEAAGFEETEGVWPWEFWIWRVGMIAGKSGGRRRDGEQAGRFAGDDEFLVGGDDQHAGARIGGGEIGLGRRRRRCSRVEHEAEVARPAQTRLAEPGVVFADAGGEHEGVAAAELEPERADPVAEAVHEDVDREPGAGVALRRRRP